MMLVYGMDNREMLKRRSINASIPKRIPPEVLPIPSVSADVSSPNTVETWAKRIQASDHVIQTPGAAQRSLGAPTVDSAEASMRLGCGAEEAVVSRCNGFV